MAVLVATHPPLGQVTQLRGSPVKVHAVLELPGELAKGPWQLALWYSDGDGGEWTEADLSPAAPEGHLFSLHGVDETRARLYFTGELTVQTSLRFTVRFRQQLGEQEWRWVRDEQGLDDGIVVISRKPIRDDDPEDLPDLIQDLNPDLDWRSHISQSPGTRLWSIDARVDAAGDDKSTYAEALLGIPWGRFLRWFALVRPWRPWLAPRHGKSDLHLDEDALLCSFLSSQGQHLVFLGISGANDVVTLFRSGGANHLKVYIRSDNPEMTTGTVLVAVGDDFESAVAALMYHARTLVLRARGSTSAPAARPAPNDGVQPKWYESWYDGLGYCTWNSLGQGLTEQRVLEALDTLAENGINVSTLIIDDNWQDIDYRGHSQWQHGWNDFEAEPKKFPSGLKALVSTIRSKHKTIQHIAVWHALLGYWAGIAPEGPLAKRYKTVQVLRDAPEHDELPIDGKLTVVAPQDVPDFYDDFYRFLASAGVDGVKTDAQYMLDTVAAPADRRALLSSYLDAWTTSALRHFSGRAISCMSQAPPVLFHAQLPRTRPPFVCRTSDDFFPAEADAHPWHIWTNAHTALLARHLNVLPDWDMFQTAHPYAGPHAAARCLSGGPVYITDVPGRHDASLLAQVTAATPRRPSRTVVLRPSVPGRSLDAYTAYDGLASLLKVGAYHGGAAPNGVPVVGLFNLTRRAVTEIVPLSMFPGVVGGGEDHDGGGNGRRDKGTRRGYVVRSHVTGKVTPPMEAGSPASLLTVSLDVRGYDVLCAYPLTVVESRTRGEVLLANLGLVGKMTGCSAVLRTVFEARENGRMLVDVTLKALGVLGVYISALPGLSIQDDFMVTIQGQPIPGHTVAVDKQDEHVLDVDVETAWEEMGLDSGWSNEVEVKVYVTLGR